MKITVMLLVAIGALVLVYFTAINPPEDREFREEVEQSQQSQDNLDDLLNNLPDPADNSGSGTGESE